MRGRDAGAAVGNEVREVQDGRCVLHSPADHCNICFLSEGNGDPLRK